MPKPITERELTASVVNCHDSTVLVQIWQMEQPAEKAVAVPEKLMENKIAMGISVLSCLVAGFSDKLKGNAKPTKSTTRSKRR